jgi:hypothetical protein
MSDLRAPRFGIASKAPDFAQQGDSISSLEEMGMREGSRQDLPLDHPLATSAREIA